MHRMLRTVLACLGGFSNSICIHAHRNLQELLQVDLFSMSLSMSMTGGPANRDANISPPTPAPSPDVASAPGSVPPSAVLLAERVISCTGSTNTPVSITLEVELAVGKTNYAKDLEQALTNALASDESYSMCDPSRRLAETKASSHEGRHLQDSPSILLSPVIVTETQQSCMAQGTSASSCVVATAEMEAFGTQDSRIIAASVDSIAKSDDTFDTKLKMNGIMDVRVVPNTNRATNIESSNSAISATSSTVRSKQTILAIVCSVAAVTLVVALILRRGSRRRRHLWYGPTMEETYDENQCLGIQPRESFENETDGDSPTYFSSKPEYPRATSF